MNLVLNNNKIMKSIVASLSLAILALALALAGFVSDVHAGPNPPDNISYQGYLVDGDGNPLGGGSPQNFEVVFRIYAQAQGGDPLWAEQQTVTVDNGNFSVILGAGSEVSPVNHGPLNQVFIGADASDRYISIELVTVGSEIAPRLRFLSSAYAFLASNAVNLVSPEGGAALVVTGNTISRVGGNARGAGAIDLQTARDTSDLVASGQNSVIVGGHNNKATGLNAVVSGGFNNLASNTEATVSGGSLNTASGEDSSIGGGTGNTASAINSRVGGGLDNQANGNTSFIGAGLQNQTSGVESGVVSGFDNQAIGFKSFIGGGNSNRALLDQSTVAGGSLNRVEAVNTFIGGGFSNVVSNVNGVISGGAENRASGVSSFVGGGFQNKSTALESGISSGARNQAQGERSYVGGGDGNIAGFNYSLVGGGISNHASNEYSAIAGGNDNSASGAVSYVGGGTRNNAQGGGSVIGGGFENTTSSNDSTVSGGNKNSATGQTSAVGGGNLNIASGLNATVPGGYSNLASGTGSVAVGSRAKANANGSFVWADTQDADYFANGVNSFSVRAGGGMHLATPYMNVGGPVNIIIGPNIPNNPQHNTRSDYKVALTMHRTDNDNVWQHNVGGDNLDYYSISANGYEKAFWGHDGAIGSNPSDRRLKKDIESSDPVLEKVKNLELVKYRFNYQNDNSRKLYGMIAQDVQEQFEEIVHDYGGKLSLEYGMLGAIACEAVKELAQEKDEELQLLREENQRLKETLESVLRRLERLEANQ